MLKECLPDHKNEKRFLCSTSCCLYLPELLWFTSVPCLCTDIADSCSSPVVCNPLWRKQFSSGSEKQRSVQRTYVLLLLCWTPILYSLAGKIRCYWNKRVGLFVCDFLGLDSGFWWFGFFSFFLGGKKEVS